MFTLGRSVARESSRVLEPDGGSLLNRNGLFSPLVKIASFYSACGTETGLGIIVSGRIILLSQVASVESEIVKDVLHQIE